MEHVGYQLVDADGNVLQSWGGVWGQCPGEPSEIRCPNGDIVCAPALDTDYNGVKIIRWMMDEPAAPTIEEKLAKIGLSVDDLKTALGL